MQPASWPPDAKKANPVSEFDVAAMRVSRHVDELEYGIIPPPISEAHQHPACCCAMRL